MQLNKVGTDPEFFIEQNSEIVASQGLLPGTKDSPFKTQHGTVHRDNVLGELGVEPASNEDEFVNNINNSINDAQLIIPDCRLRFISSHMMSPAQLMHDEAIVFGCESDMNAYTEQENIPPDGDHGNLRSAGGHVHLDFDFNCDKDRLNVVKCCDLLLGVPSIILDSEGFVRKELYGKAGAFRFKPYGIEYRTLSNFWLNSPSLMQWVFKQSKRAVEQSEQLMSEFNPDMIQYAINNNSANVAKQIINQFDIQMPEAK